MAKSNDTTANRSGRYEPFHTRTEESLVRDASTPERLRVLMLDTQAEPLDLAALVQARACHLKNLLDMFLPGLDDGIRADEVVAVLHPTVEELHTLARALSARIDWCDRWDRGIAKR